ncbi:FK506-binding protein 15-like isoform X2 [Brienomyrus brachyistius]|uniref:FK506-binding protein 15-like isoform X2 n=1 Tax=Brienomyrus brachyistius TaxID=42636 RepID=UPI0020B285BD|nr:FK506-binding protein 15-like isoform X2 [Brienomyrus brachyistius]
MRGLPVEQQREINEWRGGNPGRMELKKEGGMDRTLRRRRGVNVVAFPAVWDTTDYLWRETQATKLAMLFKLDQAQSQGNQSFQFKAPTQPRNSCPNPGLPTQTLAPPHKVPTVLFATAVHAFRYVDGQHIKVGKIGAAVLGSHVTGEYKVLLYGNKQNEVASARISLGFTFTLQSGNYGNFYDDHQQNWSVMFESEKATEDFSKQVCLAKWNSAPSLDTVVLQDLALGEGRGVERGDSLEVSYTGCLLQNHIVGQVFDSTHGRGKPLRLRLGAGKAVKGLEEGILGLQKGGRRLLVVPPSLGYGSQGIPNLVPANSTLIFETKLHRIKSGKDNGPGLVPGEALISAFDGLDCESHLPLTADFDSQTEQLIDPAASKGDLISRVARVGQPILPPLMGATSTLTKLSDPRTVDPSPKEQAARLSTQPLTSSQVTSHSPNMATASSVAPPPAFADPQPEFPGANPAFQVTSSCPHSAPMDPPCLLGAQKPPTETLPYQACSVPSFLITEAWQQNTEMRHAVGRVKDRIDQLASKVESLQKQRSLLLGMPAVSLETPALLHSIQKIIQENEGLKKDVSEKNLHITEQNMKIRELIHQNQRYLEQNILLLEEKNKSFQVASEQGRARLLQAERDKVWLTGELASSTLRLSQLQQEVTVHQQKSAELEARLSAALQDNDRNATQLASLEEQVIELKDRVALTRAQHWAEKQRHLEAECRVRGLEAELQGLRVDRLRLEKYTTGPSEQKHFVDQQEEVCDECELAEQLPRQQALGTELWRLGDTVKCVMNSVFRGLRWEFDPQETYSGQAVLGTVAHTIKSVTLQVLADTRESPGHEIAGEEEEGIKSSEEVHQHAEEDQEALGGPQQSLNGRQADGETEEKLQAPQTSKGCIQVMDGQKHQSEEESAAVSTGTWDE